MLVIHRDVGESVQIGPDIKVTMLKMKNGSRAFGIEAPKEIRISRPLDMPSAAQREIDRLSGREEIST